MQMLEKWKKILKIRETAKLIEEESQLINKYIEYPSLTNLNNLAGKLIVIL